MKSVICEVVDETDKDLEKKTFTCMIYTRDEKCHVGIYDFLVFEKEFVRECFTHPFLIFTFDDSIIIDGHERFSPTGHCILECFMHDYTLGDFVQEFKI